jgi:hypothetical protein
LGHAQNCCQEAQGEKTVFHREIERLGGSKYDAIEHNI